MALTHVLLALCFLAGAGLPGTAVASPQQSSAPLNRTGVFTCLSNNNITNIAPSSNPSWQDLAPNYNLRLQYVPDVVVVPTNNGAADEISRALGCATQNGLSVQAMSGSHSYASYSLGGKNGSMVISLLNLQDVELDATTNIAKFGAGIRLGNLALALGGHLRALSHGTGADVGSGGHFTHGGYGYTSRAWGLAMDQIVALDVVTADGSSVHATAESAPDLYYAMRGAADSFGIVVNFYVQTQPMPSSVVYFEFNFPAAATDVEAGVSAGLHLQAVAQNASVMDRNLSFGIVVGPGAYTLRGTYLGDGERFNTTILPEVLRGLPAYDAGASRVSSGLGYLDSLAVLAGGSLGVATTTPYASHDNFFAKSVTVPAPGLTEEAWRSYLTYARDQGSDARAPVSWFAIVNLEGGVDSQINARTADFAAYPHRATTWTAQNYGFVGADEVFPSEAGTAFVDGLNDAMKREMPGADFGAYINYVDPSMGRDEANLQYFGEAIYERLKGYKQVLDPGELFWNPQTIPLD